MKLFTLRRVIIAGYVASIAFLLAHTVNAFVSHTLTTITTAITSEPPRTGLTSSQNSKALARSVLTSGLFPIPENAQLIAEGGRPTPPRLPPLNVASKVSLLGTVENESSDGIAILEEIPSKRQVLYRLQQTVPGVGTIVQIEKDRVLFRQGAQEEWLAVALERLAPGFEPRISASLAPPTFVPSPKKVLPVSTNGKKTVDRQVLIDAVNNSTRLYLDAEPIAYLENGRAQGIKLNVVNFFGFFGKLGLQSGDVLKRINGLEIEDPMKLPSLVEKLKDERSLRLDIVRNGTPRTLSYEINQHT